MVPPCEALDITNIRDGQCRGIKRTDLSVIGGYEFCGLPVTVRRGKLRSYCDTHYDMYFTVTPGRPFTLMTPAQLRAQRGQKKANF